MPTLRPTRKDSPKLLRTTVEEKADVVFSSRFLGGEGHRVLYFWHAVGNKFLTLLSNMCTNLNLTDIESGYKVFKRAVIEKVVSRRLVSPTQNLRGRQEDQLEGRDMGALVHCQVLSRPASSLLLPRSSHPEWSKSGSSWSRLGRLL